MKKQILSSPFLIVAIALYCIVSMPLARSQNKNNTILQRYSTPDSINPLNINIEEFMAEDLRPVQVAADLSYQKGEYLEAARNYLYMVNRNTDDPDSYYKLAVCYSHLGRLDDALNFLVLAVNAGYVDFDMIANDEAFSRVRNNPGTGAFFQDLLDYGDKYGQTRYFKVSKLEKCLVFLPPRYDADREYPLVIGLHGNASNPYLFSDLWKDIREEEVIFAVPRSPYIYSTRGGTLTQQYSWSVITGEKALWEIADPLVIEYFAEIARGIGKEYKVSRTILFGFSQGAGFGYAGGIKHQDIFDGIICFGGRLPEPDLYPWFLSSGDLERNSGLRVFIAHGTKDEAIGVSEARRSNRTLKKHGYVTRLEVFEGGHFVPGDVLRKGIRWILEE